MSRISCLAAIAFLATIIGCGNDRATKEGHVMAMDFKDGTVKTFSNEGEVPQGWGVCPENDCGTVPPGVPCQNLGEKVCELNASCRLRTLGCTSPGYNPDSGEPPPDSTDVTCDNVCVPKGELQCDELKDKQSCADRSDCNWGQICATSSSAAPYCADPEKCGTTDPVPNCVEVCHTKQPLVCDQLDEKTCNSRSDCSWTITACPAIGCLEEDDPTCQCKPFCQPAEPPPSSSCFGNSDCKAGHYCAFEQGCGGGYGEAHTDSGNAGSSDSEATPEEFPKPDGDPMPPSYGGVCEEKPQQCTMEYGPVCGCDGKEYSNDCTAASAGVNVAHGGPCDQPPPPPLDACSVDSDCGEDEFCFFEDGACLLAMPMIDGICKRMPDACYQIYSPVCGCDGKTYGNDCDAYAQGALIAHVGECTNTVPEPECVVSGCSSQVCSTEAMDTTCEWLPEYACLKHTTCGNFAAGGSCGWEQNQDYLDCLALAKQ